jgi:genome maintenance exonuclease 1
LDFTEIKENYETGQRRYLLPDGSLVPSVTTVLSSLSKDHINVWRERIGTEAADKITNQAKNRGTAIHQLAENYLFNKDDYSAGAMPINLYDFNSNLKPLLDKYVDDLRGIESPLWSTRLKTAGRTDLIANWQNNPAIIDFKTSRKPKKESWIKNYFLQATCYSLMLQERTGIACKDIVILIAVDHEEPQVFHKKRKDYVEEVVEIFTNYSA